MSEQNYEATLALYEALIATHPEIERKGSSLPYTSINGNMFSFLSKEGQVALRLSDEDRAAFIEKYDTDLAKQNDTVMNEYVAVPDSLLANTEELAPYLAASFEYVKTLPIHQPRREIDE